MWFQVFPSRETHVACWMLLGGRYVPVITSLFMLDISQSLTIIVYFSQPVVAHSPFMVPILISNLCIHVLSALLLYLICLVVLCKTHSSLVLPHLLLVH